MNTPLVQESIVTLDVNGVHAFEWRCTPYDLEALAIGRLYISGSIMHADAAHLTIEPRGEDALHVNARVDTNSVLRSSDRVPSLPLPPPDSFIELFRTLFTTVDARHEHGGMHAAATTDGVRIVKQVEDVGRHNTIDKIVGFMLLDRLPCSSYGLLTSSRVSGEIAAKAARAGFAWLASRSIPTSLAVRYAAEAGMAIVGRAASRNAHVY